MSEKNINIFDNARVTGNALVFGDAGVSDNARVTGNARVFGDALVFGNARVFGDALVSGDARVFGDALVSGDARVFGNARVSGDGIIEKTADYLVIGPAKSSGRFTTAHKDSKIGVRVNCGCFSGTIQEFREAIETTHKDNTEALKQYRLFAQLIESNFEIVL